MRLRANSIEGLLTGSLLLLLGACREELPPRSYIDRVEAEDGDFRNSREVGSTRYIVQHLPPAYVFLQQKGPEKSVQRTWRSEKEDFEDGVRFELRIDPPPDAPQNWIKGGSPGRPNERVRYFNFGMERDLRLIGEGDTLSPTNFHFERTYGHLPYLSFLFSFSREELPEGPYTLRFANTLSKNGPVKFRFEEEVLTDPPALKLNH